MVGETIWTERLVLLNGEETGTTKLYSVDLVIKIITHR